MKIKKKNSSSPHLDTLKGLSKMQLRDYPQIMVVDDVFFNENAYNNIHDTHHHSHKRGSAYTDEDDNYEVLIIC